ncbi:MAG TPA: glycosidase, partial [Acidobacteriota bacterium]|nr:glycosidase [Acidobacteriota bacterium]
MTRREFDQAVARLFDQYESLVRQPNRPMETENGIFRRWVSPILTRAHAPVFWRYDLSYERNPHLLERFGINATFNAGAIKWEGSYVLAVRVEGDGYE